MLGLDWEKGDKWERGSGGGGSGRGQQGDESDCGWIRGKGLPNSHLNISFCHLKRREGAMLWPGKKESAELSPSHLSAGSQAASLPSLNVPSPKFVMLNGS